MNNHIQQTFKNFKDDGSGFKGLLHIVSNVVLDASHQGLMTERNIQEIRTCAQSAAYLAGAAFTALGFDRMDCNDASDNAAASGLVLAGTLLTELTYLHDSLDSASGYLERRAQRQQSPAPAAES